MTVKGDLNAKARSVNTLLGLMKGKRGFGDRNKNGKRFEGFCSFYLLGTVQEQDLPQGQLALNWPTTNIYSD